MKTNESNIAIYVDYIHQSAKTGGTVFPTRLQVLLAQTQISLYIHADWLVFAGTKLVADDPKHPQANIDDFDQTAKMRRLIWVFARRLFSLVGNVMPGLRLIPLRSCFEDTHRKSENIAIQVSQLGGIAKHFHNMS